MTSAAEGGGPIILFDGVCNLCTGSVRFVIERDLRKQFRFASLQSPMAEKLLGAQRNDADRLESVVLVAGERVYRKSTAALLITRRLDGLCRCSPFSSSFPGRCATRCTTGSAGGATVCSASARFAGSRRPSSPSASWIDVVRR